MFMPTLLIFIRIYGISICGRLCHIYFLATVTEITQNRHRLRHLQTATKIESNKISKKHY